MKADKKKVQIVMARKLLSPLQIEENAQMPRVTINKVLAGKNVQPKTLGKVARALGVDVEEILRSN